MYLHVSADEVRKRHPLAVVHVGTTYVCPKKIRRLEKRVCPRVPVRPREEACGSIVAVRLTARDRPVPSGRFCAHKRTRQITIIEAWSDGQTREGALGTPQGVCVASSFSNVSRLCRSRVTMPGRRTLSHAQYQVCKDSHKPQTVHISCLDSGEKTHIMVRPVPNTFQIALKY